MNNKHITAAAALIADIDPALARVWLKQPFNRHGMVTAFHRSLSNCPRSAGMADRIAVALRSAIDTTTAELVEA